MLAKTFALLVSLTLASAGPIKGRQDGAGCVPRPPTSSQPPATPTLPLTGGATELPAQPAGVVLKHIALGHGIQNYTCSQVTPDAPTLTAVATGALAALYDATSFYPGQSPDSLSISEFEALTTNVLWTQPLPLNSDGVTPFGASSNPFPAPADLVLPGIRPLPLIGHHYFDASGTPIFAVGADELFIGKKLNSTAAPATSDKGPEKTGTVAWLFLGDKGGSKVITFIYRVVTAGGSPHACTTVGAGDSVPYTAHYWMFGPA